MSCFYWVLVLVVVFLPVDIQAQQFGKLPLFIDSTYQSKYENIPDSSKIVAGLDWFVPPNTSDSAKVLLYKAYLKQYPKSNRAKFLLGITYSRLSIKDSVISTMMKLVSDSLFCADANLIIAYTYGLLAQSQLSKEYNLKALDAVNRNIELDSSIARNYLLRAYINTRLNNYRTVLQDYDKCLSLNMVYRDAYYWRGLARIALNQKAQGCEDILKAIKMGIGDYAVNQLCYRCEELCKKYQSSIDSQSNIRKGKKTK